MLRHRCRVNRTTLMTQRVGWVEPLRYPSPLHAPSKMMGFASAQPILRALPQAWLWLRRSLNRPAGWGTSTRLELFALLPQREFARLLRSWHHVVPRDDHQSVEENCVLDGNSVGKFLLVRTSFLRKL